MEALGFVFWSQSNFHCYLTTMEECFGSVFSFDEEDCILVSSNHRKTLFFVSVDNIGGAIDFLFFRDYIWKAFLINVLFV